MSITLVHNIDILTMYAVPTITIAIDSMNVNPSMDKKAHAQVSVGENTCCTGEFWEWIK